MNKSAQPRAPFADGRDLLANLPPEGDLKGLEERIRAIGEVGKAFRDFGDDLRECENESQAKIALEHALFLELQSIDVAKRYTHFELLFGVDGRPIPAGQVSNYPLEGGEQALAKLYCDRLGRVGGLLRRLERFEEAHGYYSIGAEIEKNGANFGVVNSYSTMNNIALKIELGQQCATRSAQGLPALDGDITAAIDFVRDQLDGPRAGDAWAKADLAMALVLSSEESKASEASELYRDYSKEARPRDIATTLRILRLVQSRLETMGDPAASTVASGIEALENEARRVKKFPGK